MAYPALYYIYFGMIHSHNSDQYALSIAFQIVSDGDNQARLAMGTCLATISDTGTPRAVGLDKAVK